MRLTQWVVGLTVVAACGVGTVWLLTPSQADRLREKNEQLAREQAELKKAIERLTAQTRLADVYVLDQVFEGDRATTILQFVEWDHHGRALPARSFVVQDEVIYFDALVMKFDAARVAAGDELRGRSIALFRRVFGEHQNPAEGQAIDAAGDVPDVFRGEREANRFERRLWAHFWDYVADSAAAGREGVRVAQGEAVYVRMRKGQQWSLTLDNNGGLNIKLCRTSTEALGSGPAM